MIAGEGCCPKPSGSSGMLTSNLITLILLASLRGEVDVKASRHLVRVASLVAGLGLAAAAASPAAAATKLHRDARRRRDLDRRRSERLERRVASLQPRLRAAQRGGRAGSVVGRRPARARLRARGLVVRPERLMVGTAERGARSVPDDRCGDSDFAAARAEPRDRGRQFDGRAHQRARGRARRRSHRRCALDLRNRCGRDSSSTTTSSTASTRWRSCLRRRRSSS